MFGLCFSAEYEYRYQQYFFFQVSPIQLHRAHNCNEIIIKKLWKSDAIWIFAATANRGDGRQHQHRNSRQDIARETGRKRKRFERNKQKKSNKKRQNRRAQNKKNCNLWCQRVSYNNGKRLKYKYLRSNLSN